jgi:hypothetical protein
MYYFLDGEIDHFYIDETVPLLFDVSDVPLIEIDDDSLLCENATHCDAESSDILDTREMNNDCSTYDNKEIVEEIKDLINDVILYIEA